MACLCILNFLKAQKKAHKIFGVSMFYANSPISKYQRLLPFFVLVKFSSKLFCEEGDSSHEEVVKLLSGKVLDVVWRSNGEGGTL